MTTSRKYVATFADGTNVTRKTDRSYSHAWRCFWKDQTPTHGFSGTAALAASALRAYLAKGYVRGEIAEAKEV